MELSVVGLVLGATAPSVAAPRTVPLPLARPPTAEPPAGSGERKGDLADDTPGSSAPTAPEAKPSSSPGAETGAAGNAGPPPAKPSPTASSCLASLRSAGFVVEAAETPKASDKACRIEDPVRLTAVPARSTGGVVALPGEPVLACRFAKAFGGWVGDLAAPVIAGSLGTKLAAVRTGPGFECRRRNRSAAGPLSAHATGTAIDVSSFLLADGSSFAVTDGEARRTGAVATLRTGACGWFTTILGPGSDPAHTDHIHLDIEPHGKSDRYRICQ